jgi:hypothetical protein
VELQPAKEATAIVAQHRIRAATRVVDDEAGCREARGRAPWVVICVVNGGIDSPVSRDVKLDGENSNGL